MTVEGTLCYDKKFTNYLTPCFISFYDPLAFDDKVWYNGSMKKIDYRQTENRITHACRYHVAWCCNFRRPVLTEPMRTRLKGLIQEVCTEQQIKILDIEVTEYYVRLWVDIPPMESVNCCIRKMKRQSSRVLCKEFPKLRSRLPSLWTLHYYVSTQDVIPFDDIKDWMETQPRSVPKPKKKGASK